MGEYAGLRKPDASAPPPIYKGPFHMPAIVLDGKSLAAQSEAELQSRVERLKEKSGGKTPILATILVGDDPASATYVKNER